MARQGWAVGFTKPNGTFVTGKGGTRSFVPSPLPPEWDMVAMRRAYVRAEAAVSSLGAIMRMAGVAGMAGPLASLYIRREAVQSSRIEGTLASLDDLLRYEAGGRVADSEAARLGVVEAANCAMALEAAMGAVRKGGGITTDLVRLSHRMLWQGVSGQERCPGSTRTVQNAIVVESGGESDVVYVPPPPGMVGGMLDALVAFMDSAHPGIPAVVQCAMAHYQFEAIHPFGDGNGRVGRMLIPLILARSGALSWPLLQLGEYMAHNRREYYGRLERVSKESDWDGWIALFMRAFAEQAEETVDTIVALVEIRERYAERIRGGGRSVASRIVGMLFANPHVTTRSVMDALGVPQAGAARGISRLARAGILRRVPSRRRAGMWVAHEIARAVQPREP